MRWAGTWVIVSALAVLSAAGCARTYEIRLTRPVQVGAEYRLEGTGEIMQETTYTSGGKTVQQGKGAACFELNARIKALAVDEKGRETAVLITIEKCVKAVDGERAELLAGGTVVSGRVEGRRGVFEVKGKAVTPGVREALKLFGPLTTGGPTEDDVFGTSERVRVGECWLVNAALAAEDARRNDIPMREEDVGGYMTLEEVVTADGVECLHIRGTLTEAGVSPPGLPKEMELRKGDLQIDMWGLFPVDTSKMPRISSMKQTLAVTAVGPIEKDGPVMTLDMVMKWGSSMKLSPVE